MARILDITPEVYHRDPCATPSLSASTAKTLIFKSAAHAWLEHPRLGNVSRESTDSMDKGSIIHELVLGKGSGLQIIEADDFRTNKAKEARDAAVAAGKTPVIAKKMEMYQAVADIIGKKIVKLIGRPIPTMREVCIEWEYTIDSRDDSKAPRIVLCRSMLDAVDLDTGFILDLKATETSVSQLECEKKMCSMGYDIQGVAYIRAIEQLRPELAGRIDCRFAFAELDQPWSVTPGWLSAEMKALGESRLYRAAVKWERCLRQNNWPDYTDKTVTFDPPTYEMTREEEIRECGL